MTITLTHYLLLGAALFTIGAVGVVVRRNALTVLMSIEVMLNAANLTFVAFSRFPLNHLATYPYAVGKGQPALGGHVAAIFIIAVAAAEAAVGLAIIIAVFRRRQTTHVDELTSLHDPEQSLDGESAPAAAAAGGH